jgi:hypothetical protein
MAYYSRYNRPFLTRLTAGLLLLAVFWPCQCLASCPSNTGWAKTDPLIGYQSDMVCSEIIKKWNNTWFHYKTETCPLMVEEVYDLDWYNDGSGWTRVEVDYHDHGACTWYGNGLTDVNGHRATWRRIDFGPTGEDGETIAFSMDDCPDTPFPAYPGHTVDDSGSRWRYKQMYAFGAVAYLNVTSHLGTSTTGDIHEYTDSNDEIFKTFNQAVLKAHADSETKTFTSWANAKWKLRRNPANAYLSSAGQLKVDIGMEASGQLKTRVYDNDDDVSSVSVGVTLFGAGGLSAFVSITIPVTDDCEGSAGTGFAFSSDDLGSQATTELEETSSVYWNWELPKTATANYSYSELQTFYGGIGDESLAKAIIEAEAHCEGGPAAWAEISSDAGTGDGGVTYTIGVPTYEPGSGLVQNPDWPE